LATPTQLLPQQRPPQRPPRRQRRRRPFRAKRGASTPASTPTVRARLNPPHRRLPPCRRPPETPASGLSSLVLRLSDSDSACAAPPSPPLGRRGRIEVSVEPSAHLAAFSSGVAWGRAQTAAVWIEPASRRSLPSARPAAADDQPPLARRSSASHVVVADAPSVRCQPEESPNPPSWPAPAARTGVR